MKLFREATWRYFISFDLDFISEIIIKKMNLVEFFWNSNNNGWHRLLCIWKKSLDFIPISEIILIFYFSCIFLEKSSPTSSFNNEKPRFSRTPPKRSISILFNPVFLAKLFHKITIGDFPIAIDSLFFLSFWAYAVQVA